MEGQSRQSDRLFFQSSELGPFTHSPAGECVTPLSFGGGDTLAGDGVEGSNSDEGTDTVVLSRYICTLWMVVSAHVCSP
jgi:hypothetical protein